MLEDQVAYLLQRYLGNYVRGLSKEALKISVWQGNVELTNMQLKPEALNALKLPIKVKAGFLGSVKLKVPWSRIGQEPVLVYLDRIYLLAEPETQIEGYSEDAVQKTKKSRIHDMEMKMLESRQILTTEMNKSWLGSFINTIIGNLKLSISSIHIRYEDLESNPGHPFAAGVTLEKLSASTVDDSGKEAFVTGGALDILQKSVELEKLAVYLDSDITPWHITKPWDDLQPSEWDQVFSFGTKDGKPANALVQKHTYVLQPVTGNAKYSKQRSNSSNRDQPLQKAAVSLDDVTISLAKSGYRDVLKLADNFSAFNQRLKYAHFRPLVPVKSDPRSWWRYACRVVSDQIKKASGRTSWEQVLKYATLRKRYISLYASLLKSDPSREIINDDKDIEELDRELDIELIVQWRMLAHKFLEKSQSDIYLKKQNTKKSWWSFGWNSGPAEDDNQPRHFTDEDWKQLNEIIGYKEGDNSEELLLNDDRGDVLHTLLEVHMKHNASRLTEAHEFVAELSCENLDCLMKFYKDAKVFDMKLGSYRLSSPDGLLAESATSYDSLVGVFRYKPFDAKVDWSMVAKASPCYVTYLKNPVDQIVNFFESNAAVSQKMALETAAAVQLTIDEVKRSAQQQVNKALKDHARFFLDLDIAAPKITIPTDFSPDNRHSTKLLLDLGNLIIRTQDDSDDDVSLDKKDIYLQFGVVLSDVSAFFVDGDYHWSEQSLKGTSYSSQSSIVSFLPVIDKCGVTLKLQQIRSEDPSFPATRLAVRLPFLGFHFSPARYHRLMQVAKIFQGEDNDTEDLVRPWDQADFEGWLSVLNWKGVGNREAVWQRRYFCLVGPFLYVLEAPGSRAYKQSFSLLGKQVYAVPPEIIGDVENVLAVCRTERSISKVVEDANALILRCESDESRKNWRRLMQGAIYRASGSAPITGLSETSSESEDSEVEEVQRLGMKDVSKAEKLFITGVLDELKLCFNYSTQTDRNFIKVLLAEEIRLFELRAIGGRVELSIRENDMFIGTVLKALEVEDLVSCKGGTQPCYLARSFIHHADAPSVFQAIDGQGYGSSDRIQSDADDNFYEAPESLNDPVDSPGREFEHSSSLSSERAILKTPSFSRIAGLLPDDANQGGEKTLEVTDTLDSFVKAQIVFIDSNSVFYDNIDKRVTVTLATLSFYCRRPIILAIMEFVSAINTDDENLESFSDDSSAVLVNDSSEVEVVNQSSAVDESKVRGLLGRGRSRIVFFLTLNMARAQILLMKEDGTKLATMSQDNFLTEIKVFPSSFSIKASLGNLRISDDSLHSSHMYFWACDMRNPGGSSFVELVFSSFNADDEDYAGFEYSLIGQLSEVRLVYLNRFIQEIINYFMGLVPNNSVVIVKVKDQVTDSEKWVKTSEIEGSPAVKLDLSLRKPIILMPRRTDSLDYLKLDIVHITVQNTFQWFGGTKKEINAVHLDIMTIKVEDINLNVGMGAELGESIIHDVKGVRIVIRRSLRDLLHQVPNTEVAIKIDELKASLSNKEYHIISECALSNFSEAPNDIPPLKNSAVSASTDVIDPLVRQGSEAHEYETQNEQAWISMKVSVVVGLVEMSLHYGMARDASLATLQVSGLWVLYKADTLGEGLLSATLKGFTVNDDREGTEEELRLAVRQPKSMRYNPDFEIVNEDNEMVKADVKYDEISGDPTMLILDAKFSQYSTTLSLCIQRPQLLVALDFLMAVAEFFVPTVRDILSSDEDEKSSFVVDALILEKPTFNQSDEVLTLSPQNPLVVDGEECDHYTYDGRGGTLLLQDRDGEMISSTSVETMIYIGSGKRLQFKNVTIKNGQFLDLCVSLGSSSSYSALKDDQVFLEESEEIATPIAHDETKNLPTQSNTMSRSTETSIELQVISPELTFYNSSKYVGESPLFSNKFLHARLDAFCRLVMKGDTIEMSANALGLTMESNGIRILEPFDTSVKFSNASGKTNIHVAISDIFMNFSFSALRLFLAVEEDVLKFLRMTSRKMTIACSEFDKLGTFENTHNNETYAFWRPHAPPGFAILGDYLTAIDKPPTKGVLAVNTRYVKIKKPEAFKLVWPPSDAQNGGVHQFAPSIIPEDGAESCSIWFPVAPKGYVALGCVVSPGRTQPSLSSAFCLHASLVSPCALRDCVTISSGDKNYSGLAFWRVDNSLGTFLPADPGTLSVIGRAYELRHILFGFHGASSKSLKGSNVQTMSSDTDDVQRERSSIAASGWRFQAVASFRLIWGNQGSKSSKKLSIWRPIIPEGMVYFGDIAVRGYDSPNTCIVLPDDDELFKVPTGFQMVGQIKKHRGAESITFWLPQPPPGYVSLGCVAFKGTPKQSDLGSLRCMRSDIVTGDDFLEESIWDTSDVRFTRESFSLWGVGNELGTFMLRGGIGKKPPRRFALKLVDSDTPSGSDDTVIDAEIRTFSVALFDDYGGMMTPLFNVSLSSVGFSLHKRLDYLNSTVSFSLAARSYNDKLEAWEPLVEPVDAVLRYQYDANAPSAASQLRLTSTRDLNINISVSNANMLIQAYASWNNLSQVHEPSSVREAISPSGGTPIIDVHHRKNYFVIPQNKLGQDIYVRATESRGLPHVIKMPSGEKKPLKVPVSKNMLDSHLKGNLYKKLRPMVTVIISQAQFPRVEGLGSHQYGIAVCLTPGQSSSNGMLLGRQSARTCGASSDSDGSSNLESVTWNEIFFFKADPLDDYTLEFVATDMGKGLPIGYFSASLKELQGTLEDSTGNIYKWLELSPANSSKTSTQVDISKATCGRIKCVVLLSSRSAVPKTGKGFTGDRSSGYLQISPSGEGPWSTVRLNYVAHAACWPLGNAVVASEVIVEDGNRYVNIRSLVSVSNTTDIVLDLCLQLNSSNPSVDTLDDTSNHSSTNETNTEDVQKHIFIGELKPGESIPLPLFGLIHSGLYVLQLRPSTLNDRNEYSWSSVMDKHVLSNNVNTPVQTFGINVSSLEESEELLYCSETSGTSSNRSSGMWFCLAIQASEISKDISSDPIQDWNIVVKSPLSITNYLPLAAEYSVLEMQTTGHFITSSRGIFTPGETVKVLNADIRNPLYFSLLPQRGWLPIHEAVLLSHPSLEPAKTLGLRSSVSGRVVHLVLEQNFENERPLAPKILRVYSPYWLTIARCPPLTIRLVDMSSKKIKSNVFSPFKNKKVDEVVLEEITDEEFHGGYTIASALNFKLLGISTSISDNGNDHFGKAQDLTALGDMDGSLGISACDAEKNCMHLFVSSKPTSYQSVPTKVIAVRPYMTFTNRLGQDIYVKLSSEDPPKLLRASDVRVSFVCIDTEGPSSLQIRAEGTDWSFPVKIEKEDTIFLVLKKEDGTQDILRTEIRGYEEGSRFIVVFRRGPKDGPTRIENRTTSKIVRFCQSGIDDADWIRLEPHASTKFSWVNPYGQKSIDAEVHSDDNQVSLCELKMDNSGECQKCGEGTRVVFHVVEMGNIKVARFVDDQTTESRSDGLGRSLVSFENWKIANMPNKEQENPSPLELIVELGVVGVSLVDHRPKELCYLYLERVFISYSTGYDNGTTSRFKLILGHLQLDNQLPLTLMPVLLAPEEASDTNHPVFKMSITISNENADGIQVYPHVFIRVTDKIWRLNIHEPIIWASVEFFGHLQLDRLPQSSSVAQVDPEILINLIDVSEVRLKLSLETAPAQRPHGVLGVWSPILSAVGNAFKLQIHLRKVMHKDRYMRKSSVGPAISNRIFRDLIHNPLHLIFSLDVLGMTSSTLASLSKGFAELSTDGQFLQLRSKQVWSRRITGVGDGFLQGTEALAQGVAFGVSGVVRKPVENARQNGLLGLAHGLGQACLGFVVQPVSGALDFFSLTVDGIGASFTRCLEVINNKTIIQRIRNPRAIRADNVLREYSETEALGQMILYLAEASRRFGCTDIFKEPSKYAWSDLYEDHFIVPYHRIVLVTSKRVMLLQCSAPEKMDKKPCKIMWDVPWEDLMALELAKAGNPQPSHLILHLMKFKKAESFVRVIKCSTEEESEARDPQAVRICMAVRKMWKAYQSSLKSLVLTVPSSKKQVSFAWNENDTRNSRGRNKSILKSRDFLSPKSTSDNGSFVKHVINFSKVWTSEQKLRGALSLSKKNVVEDNVICSIWRPICPEGYVSVGDIARCGTHPPNVAAVYQNTDRLFALPLGYDLVWRNCADDYTTPVSIWRPRPPQGYVSAGCVAMSSFTEPAPDLVYCMAESIAEETTFEEQQIWSAPDSYPWTCCIYQAQSPALHFVALRQPRDEAAWKPMRVIDDTSRPSVSLLSEASSSTSGH